MTRIFAALFLIAVFVCGVILALLPRGPQFAMTEVTGLDEDGYFQGRRMIPDQVRIGSEGEE